MSTLGGSSRTLDGSHVQFLLHYLKYKCLKE